MGDKKNQKWWHSAVGYQIYPKSFQDTNGDGVGDIQGIIRRLDELKELGITVIWVSPINLSPMIDHGYDIADYFKIDPVFGTNEDFEELIREASKREIKILMDLVINHTSDQHVWFQKALADLDSEYADYYMIREGENGQPPNNWRSMFGGSAWEQIPGTNKYYLHLFTVGQPDLNWENPKLRDRLYQIIKYWLDKGLAGYRVDAIAHIKKLFDYENLPADGPDGLVTTWKHYRNAAGIGKLLGDMRDKAFKEHDILTIAEMDVPDPVDWEEFIGDNGYFSSIFDFCHSIYNVQAEEYRDQPLKMVELIKKDLLEKQQLANDRVFFTNYLENHDMPRATNRLIPAEYIGFHSQSLMGIAYFFLRGIPVIYQGQEIGMVDYPKQSIDGYIDLATHNNYQDYLLKGLSEQEALRRINYECRENSRTPMQWDGSVNAGFTEGTPWFDVNPDYPERNYELQKRDSESLLSFYKKLVALRKKESYQEHFVYGRTNPFLMEQVGCIAYYREYEGKRIGILCNATAGIMKVELPHPAKDLLLSNYHDVQIDQMQIELQPFQGVVYTV